MIRLLIAAFLVGHGLIHGIMFSLPCSAQASAGLPFNPSHSWLLGTTRSVGLAVALAVTLGFVVVGAAYLVQMSWWPAATLVAAALSVALLALYFTRWWSVGIVISAAVAVVAWRVQQAA
jgi:hypothetical protein